MATITQVVGSMQELLTTDAERIGRETGWLRRVRKLTASLFVQIAVMGVRASPATSYTHWSTLAASLGLNISVQGLAKRFTPEAATFLRELLVCATQRVVTSEPVAVPLLKRFADVVLYDSSIIGLPTELAEVWSGVGSTAGPTAALKLHSKLSVVTGQVSGPALEHGRRHDQHSPFQQESLPPGTLRLTDLGFFDLDKLAEDERHGVYWLGRYKLGTAVYLPQGQRLDLLQWLRRQGPQVSEVPIHLGQAQRLPCRLIAVPLSQAAAERQRRKLREWARKKQKPITPQRLALAGWVILITNVPPAKLSAEEVLVLRRVRWQIELLFKLWKHYGYVDKSRSKKPWRILCEVYAKLIGLLLSHWITLIGLWAYPDRSLFKAVQVIQLYALSIAQALSNRADLMRVLEQVNRCLIATCHMNKRKTHPNTNQLLLEGA